MNINSLDQKGEILVAPLFKLDILNHIDEVDASTIRLSNDKEDAFELKMLKTFNNYTTWPINFDGQQHFWVFDEGSTFPWFASTLHQFQIGQR